MRVSWSWSVVLVAMAGCVAALLIALMVGPSSQAESPGTPPFAAPSGGVEVASLRTENSRTYREDDGSLVARVSQDPVNYRDGSGVWRPIDTSLRPDGSGGLETTASAAEVSLPQSLDAAAKVSDGSRWVSFALAGADATEAPTVSGSTATYPDTLDGVDAVYDAQPGGVKESLTLADASAPSSYRFVMDSSAGLTPSLGDDGAVVFRDGDGRPRFWLPAPTVQDADAPVPTSSHVAYRLSDDHQTLSVVVDPDWLAGAAFPVKVDPTVYLGGQSSCTLASGSLASTADCDGTTLKVGHDASHTYRAAVRFTGIDTAVPRTASVIGAELHMYLESQTTSGATTPVNVVGLATQLGGGATWNTYNGTNAWTTPGGDIASGPTDALPAKTTMIPAAVDGWVNFDIAQLAEKWVRDPATANKGLLVKAVDETANNVLSYDGTTWDHGNPTLSINYELHPGSERDQRYEGVAIDDRSGLSVNTVSGNVAVTSTDISLPGVAGLDLTVGRSFNGQNLGNGSGLFGSAWSDSINGAGYENDRIWYDDARVIHANGGAIYRFDRNFAGDDATYEAYVTPPGIDADFKVVKATGIGTLTFRKTGLQWVYANTFDSYHNTLSQIKDRHGNHIDITPKSGTPNKIDYITDTYGRRLSFSYGSNAELTRITDASGRHWDYSTDHTTSPTHNVLTGFTNPDLKTTSYHYDTGALPGTWDKLDKITDARGHDITLAYSGSTGDYSQVTSVTRPLDATPAHDIAWQFNYKPTAGVGHTCTSADAIGRTLETDPLSGVTTYCYNKSGQVIETWDASTPARRVDTTYTPSANVATFTGLAGTANPSLTTYGFASNGNATGASTKIDASHTQASTIKYCDDALQPACSSSSYAQAKYQPTLATDSQGTSQAFAYNTTGDLTDVTTSSGSDHQQLHYTSAGEVDWSKDGNLRQTTYGYTSHFLTSVTPPAPLAAEAFTADSLDRIHTATDGAGQTATVTYDGEDRITRVDWSPSNKWMTFTYDNDGNVTQRADGTSTTTTNATTYGYDWANRRTSESFPSSRTNTYVYDKASNLTSVTDPDGVVSYTYDPANRLTSVTSPKPTSGTDTITYAYTDPAGSTDPSKVTVAYPGSGGVTGTGLKQETTSDAAGNVLSVKILNSSGTTLKSRTYVHTISSSATSSLIQTVTDEAGNLTTYTHGAADRLTQAKTTNGATPVDQWDYLFDAAGNRTRRTHTVGAGSPVATSYAYNTANEMCWSVPGTTPGTCSCPTPTTCTATPGGGTTYSYDANGQRTTGATYDALERLSALGANGLGYLSPGNGELVSYGTTGYQNSVLGLSRQIPSTGSATDVVRDTGGAPVAQRVGTASKQELFSDALGSTIAMADDSANTISRNYTYDPDGNASTTGSGATTNLLFASGHQVGSLYHYGARYYDPATATWTQQDPINQIGSLTQANHYTYVSGDPIDGSDLTGTVTTYDPCSGPLCSPYSPSHSYPNEGSKPYDTYATVVCFAGGARSFAARFISILTPVGDAYAGLCLAYAGYKLYRVID
jgi:RHS repeat-associated protein